MRAREHTANTGSRPQRNWGVNAVSGTAKPLQSDKDQGVPMGSGVLACLAARSPWPPISAGLSLTLATLTPILNE